MDAVDSYLADQGQFEEAVYGLFVSACRKGCRTVSSVDDLQKEDGRSRFITACHSGFSEAQHGIVRLLPNLVGQFLDAQAQARKARGARDKEAADRWKSQADELDYRIRVIRRLADSIAWQLVGGQSYVARRLYFGYEPIPVSQASLRHALETATAQNLANPLSFSLITDLTLFIQLGDLITVDASGQQPTLTITELKEGAVNDKIRSFLDFLYESKCERALYLFLNSADDHTRGQTKRMIAQDVKGAEATSVLNTGSGVDPSTRLKIRIGDLTHEVSSYDEEIECAIAQARDQGWGINVVDDCLYVGAYAPTFPGYLTFCSWIAGYTGTKNPQIWDLRQGFQVPLSSPLFVRKFCDQCMMDITFGAIQVLLYLDLAAFTKMAAKEGISLATLSKRESNKTKAEIRKEGSTQQIRFWEADGRILTATCQDETTMLGDGLLVRLFFDGTRPRSLLQFMKPTE